MTIYRLDAETVCVVVATAVFAAATTLVPDASNVAVRNGRLDRAVRRQLQNDVELAKDPIAADAGTNVIQVSHGSRDHAHR